MFKKAIREIFISEDYKFAENYFLNNELNNKFTISIHFRRNAEKLNELYKLIIENRFMENYVKVIAMGSTEHQMISILNKNKTISVIDSYKKGIYLRSLLCIGLKTNLFLGGRGGFETFFKYAGIPSINLFDQIGFEEIECGLFGDKLLWQDDGVLDVNKFNAHDIFESKIIPQFEKWHKKFLAK